jgi:hypothetical protein
VLYQSLKDYGNRCFQIAFLLPVLADCNCGLV